MKLISFCGSHINSEYRYYLLNNMIKSMIKQEYKIPFYISISYDNIYEYLINKLYIKYKNHNIIKIFIQSKQYSQFEHYLFLCLQISEIFHNNTWILFNDDDDYSHPLRSKIYKKLLDDNKIDKTINSLYCPNVLKIDNNFQITNTYEYYKNNRNIIFSGEYYVYCTKLSVLKKFCYIMKSFKLLNTHLCDIVFGSILLNTESIIYKESKDWLYLYNNRSSSDNSRTSENYYIDYYYQNYSQKLFDYIAKEFNFNWIIFSGYTDLFDKELQIKYNKNKPTKRKIMKIIFFIFELIFVLFIASKNNIIKYFLNH